LAHVDEEEMSKKSKDILPIVEPDFESEEIVSERMIELDRSEPEMEPVEVQNSLESNMNKSMSMHKEVIKARERGYTGDICPECGSMTMVRNGTCLKCTTCGATTGCS
jgi:ribonucleoside-diphosphate reductase alpha chain